MNLRTNLVFSIIVNRSLIMNKLQGQEKAIRLLLNAGLPKNVINRVLKKSANVRTTDWK